MTQNGGKSELKRAAGGGVNKLNYFGGWAEFVKMAARANGTFTLISADTASSAPNGAPPVAVYLCTGEGKITRTAAGQPFPLVGQAAVGVVHETNTDLHAATLPKTQFISSACISGAGLAF